MGWRVRGWEGKEEGITKGYKDTLGIIVTVIIFIMVVVALQVYIHMPKFPKLYAN
jgi:hypothetical protein